MRGEEEEEYINIHHLYLPQCFTKLQQLARINLLRSIEHILQSQ